jgi:hypothetical protein
MVKTVGPIDEALGAEVKFGRGDSRKKDSLVVRKCIR